MIYTFVLGVGTIEFGESDAGIDTFRIWDTPRMQFSLLCVCRQIHAETSLLPYKLNTFEFWGYPVLYIKKFLEGRNEA